MSNNYKITRIMAKYICTKCGAEVESSRYWRGVASEMEERQFCHECNFWQNHIDADKTSNKDVFVVADGNHYIIGDENSTDSFRGYSGAKVTVKFFDGRVVKTSNLWCQGEIPEAFKAEMPDNAELIWKWED